MLQRTSSLTEFVTAQAEHIVDGIPFSVTNMSESEYYSDGDGDYEQSENSDSVAGGQGHSSDGEAEVMDVDHDYSTDCCPLACTTFTGSEGSQSGRACQVCLYEGRGQVLKDVVVCKAHKVRVCANISLKEGELVEWLKSKRRSVSEESFEWYADWPDATCWEKLHFYYGPKGLFPSRSAIAEDDSLVKKSGYCGTIKSSTLYQKREVHIKMFKDRSTAGEVKEKVAKGRSKDEMR